MAAALHIHVMRNTFFGVIVTAWCACHLSTGGPQATILKGALSVSSEGLWMKALCWKCKASVTSPVRPKPFPSMPKTRNPRRDASAYLQGVTLISTIETTLKRHMPLARGRCSKRAIGAAAIAAVPMSGCANSPSIGVLGAYFPDWLFCIVAGVVLTVVIYLILKRLQADNLMGPSAVVYPTLVAFLALAVWLMFFQH